MAIDHRIIQSIGVKNNAGVLDIFNKAMNYGKEQQIQQQGIDLNQQRIDSAQINIGNARQAQDEYNSPNAKADRGQQEIFKISQNYAKSVKPFMSNPQALLPELQRQRAMLASAGVDQSILDGIDGDIQQAQTPQGLAELAGEIDGILQIGAGNNRVAVRSSAPIVDIKTGQLSIPTFDPNTLTTKLIPVDGAIQETPEQKRQADILSAVEKEKEKAKLQGRSSAVSAAVSKGGAAFDSIAPIKESITLYDDAIASIDAGANTGVVYSKLPSIRTESIKLDNLTKKLGLNVIGSTTFGALSEGEREFAVSSALPSNLEPQELKQWLLAKKVAQQKVLARVEEAASFLSDGTHTIKDWIEYDKANQLNIANSANQQATQKQKKPGGVLKVDANGNRAIVYPDGTFEEQ